MNIQEYISSGIIESYVLGLASPEERVEFEKMCALYPELIEARNNFELAIEKQAFQDSIPPPAGSKEKTWSAIQQSATKSTSKIISMESRQKQVLWAYDGLLQLQLFFFYSLLTLLILFTIRTGSFTKRTRNYRQKLTGMTAL